MGANLLPVWEQIERYLKEGVSIIPIGGEKKPPRGYEWKQYQTSLISRENLFEDLDRLNLEAVAIIGGKVSGNLEIIDIDVKNKAEAAEDLFATIKLLYPELFARVRIHRSPSGGFHILYRCIEPVPGSLKLASRPNPTPGVKPTVLCFIETRGEGGYAVGPPSMGYEIVKDAPLPIFTKAERDALINCCLQYDELPEQTAKPYKATAQESTIYELTPFEHFNQTCDPSAVADGEGWKVINKRSPRFTWYTRPGKSEGVSMSFNNEKRFFFCFTSSTELEPSKGYTPANFLSVVRFNGDKKQLYDYLVSLGYGRLKKSVEHSLIRKAALNNEQLPANVSPEGREVYEHTITAIQENNPYGTFWFEGRFGTAIDREALIKVAGGLGFCLYKEQLHRVEEQILYLQTEREFYDAVKAYISEPDTIEKNEIYNAWEIFIEQHGKFTISRLPILDINQVLHDSLTTCYKCFENGILEITAEGFNIIQYNQTTLLIPSTSLLPRQFVPVKDAELTDHLYPSFLRLAVGPITPYIFSVIGYLSHEFKDETTAYIILLSEQCENPRDGGGSGKNIFSSLFKHTTTYHSKPGSGIKYDEKFLQSWSGQRIMCISDVEKNFKFMFLKELSSGTGLQKKLFFNEREVPVEEMPKFIVSSNYSFETIDGGVKRRVMPVEFTNYFTHAGGVDVHFKAHFPNGWTVQDWNAYDSIVAKGVFIWLSGGLKLTAPPLTAGGWAKQFEQTYGATISGYIRANFDEWLKSGQVESEAFKRHFTEYMVENGIQPIYRPSMQRLNTALHEHCKRENVAYEQDGLGYVNGIKTRLKTFHKIETTPF